MIPLAEEFCSAYPLQGGGRDSDRAEHTPDCFHAARQRDTGRWEALLIPGWRSLWASSPGRFEQGQLRGGVARETADGLLKDSDGEQLDLGFGQAPAFSKLS